MSAIKYTINLSEKEKKKLVQIIDATKLRSFEKRDFSLGNQSLRSLLLLMQELSLRSFILLLR